jgi:hypothetical protein
MVDNSTPSGEPVYNCMELVYPYMKLVYPYQRVCIDTLCVEAISWLIYDSLMMVKFYQLLHGTRDRYWHVKMDKWERIVEENPIPPVFFTKNYLIEWFEV